MTGKFIKVQYSHRGQESQEAIQPDNTWDPSENGPASPPTGIQPAYAGYYEWVYSPPTFPTPELVLSGGVDTGTVHFTTATWQGSAVAGGGSSTNPEVALPTDGTYAIKLIPSDLGWLGAIRAGVGSYRILRVYSTLPNMIGPNMPLDKSKHFYVYRGGLGPPYEAKLEYSIDPAKPSFYHGSPATGANHVWQFWAPWDYVVGTGSAPFSGNLRISIQVGPNNAPPPDNSAWYWGPTGTVAISQQPVVGVTNSPKKVPYVNFVDQYRNLPTTSGYSLYIRVLSQDVDVNMYYIYFYKFANFPVANENTVTAWDANQSGWSYSSMSVETDTLSPVGSWSRIPISSAIMSAISAGTIPALSFHATADGVVRDAAIEGWYFVR